VKSSLSESSLQEWLGNLDVSYLDNMVGDSVRGWRWAEIEGVEDSDGIQVADLKEHDVTEIVGHVIPVGGEEGGTGITTAIRK
jgi:hypothetical protein